VRWIVPEDDALSCIDEELGQRVMDLFGVHGWELRYQMHVTGYVAKARVSSKTLMACTL
jgi:hypothetical protein